MSAFGSLSPHPRPHAPAPDPARGVFETVLVVDGRPVELDAHLARLAASARALYGREAPAAARELLEARARGLALGRARVTVAPAGEALAAQATGAPIERALLFPGPRADVRLAPIVVDGWRGGHKWADRRLLEAAEAACAPARPLLVDADGSVLETSRANVAAVLGGALVTPPADGRVLPGVTRAQVLAIARDAGVAVAERPLTLAELERADEVLLTGAVRGIEAVAGWAGERRWERVPVTRALAAALAGAWRIPPSDGV